MDINIFFPPAGGDYERPRSVCQECPVREECLAEAMARETSGWERHGMFGGLTPNQRGDLAGQRVRSEPCPVCATPFIPTRGKKACSPRCSKVRYAKYFREWQRMNPGMAT